MKNPNPTPKNIVYATARPHPSQLRRQRRAALWVGLGALMIILPLILVSGTIIFFQVNHLNLPYVFIIDQDVGLISRDETAALIDSNWNQNRTIHLLNAEDPDIRYQFLPAELGIWVDPQATASAVYAIGRSSQPFEELLTALKGQSHRIMPVLYFDQDRAREALETIAGDLDIPPVDARIVFQDGRWTTTPGSDGQAVILTQHLNISSRTPSQACWKGQCRFTSKPYPQQLMT
jgi:hypothetical protein